MSDAESPTDTTETRTAEQRLREIISSFKIPIWRRILPQINRYGKRYGPHFVIMFTWALGAWLVIPDANADSAQWLLSTEAQALAALAGILLVGFTLTATSGANEEARLRQLSKRYIDLLVQNYGGGPIVEEIRSQMEELLASDPDVLDRVYLAMPDRYFKTGRDVYVAICVLCDVAIQGPHLRFDPGFERIGWKSGVYDLAYTATSQANTPLKVMRFIYNFFFHTAGAINFSPDGSKL